MDDAPIIPPWDPKELAEKGVAHPRIFALCVFMLALFAVALGIACVFTGKLVLGMFLATLGIGSATIMTWKRFSEVRMVKRMRRRGAGRSPNEPTIT
jgi:hypothetical protein